MKYLTSFILIIFSVLIKAQADTSLILSEIMFNAQSGNNEFIEIYNFSETQSFDLNGYRIKYASSSDDIITDAGEGTIIPPNSFAVIFEGDYDIQNGIYSQLVPEEALILVISNNAFGTSGMANTEDRVIRLINPSDDTLQVYTYSADNSQAISDEKVEMKRNNSPENWGNSLVVNGTPGFINSVTPLEYDLRLQDIIISPSVPVAGEDITITVKVINSGLNTASSYDVEIYNDLNFNSLPETNELVFTESLTNLESGDSSFSSTILAGVNEGEYQIISQVIFPEDDNTSDNQRTEIFTVFPAGIKYNDVVINEIMYAPSSGEPEWIELYNRSDSEINLKKWKLSDLSTSITIANEDVILETDGFIVLTSDSALVNFYQNEFVIIELSLPALNNTGDEIVIKDSLGIIADSLVYEPAWGGNKNGRSLERISVDSLSTDPANWGTSVSIFNATPGYINSITPKDFDLQISYFAPEKDFGILGESIRFGVTVKNSGLMQSEGFEVSLYKDENQDSLAQANEFIAMTTGSVLSEGDSVNLIFETVSFDEGSNYFIALLSTAFDQDTTNNTRYALVTGVVVNEVRNDVVLNEIMYSPDDPQPEWFEIYNRSSKEINLLNYQTADYNDTVTIIEQPVILHPGEYFVISSDSSLLNYYNIPSGFISANFPSLNNSGDKLMLLDSLGRIIDSLQYNSTWGGERGVSLERIDVNLPATDSSNWSSSIGRLNATPGYINSVTPKEFDLILSDIGFTPPFPQSGDNVFPEVIVKNNGLNSAVFSLSFYEDTDLDSVPDLFLSGLDNLSLAAGEAAGYNIDYLIENLQETRGFYASVIFESDQDTSNNRFYRTIALGFPPGTVIINEIMYTPAGGEPEWIELLNNSEHPVNLLGWSVLDLLTTPSEAIVTDSVQINPGEFIIVTKDLSLINYHRFVPSQIITAGLPSFNNDEDGVVLKDNRGAVIDSVRYLSNWGGQNGFSLEKISKDVSSVLESNWGSSVDIELSTPGRINSLTPKEYDLSVTEMNFDPRFPVSGDDVFISAKIKNNGSSVAGNFSVSFLIDSDSNNVVDSLIDIQTGLSLQAGDSLNLKSRKSISNLQSKILAAINISFIEDEDTLNNYSEKTVEPGFAQKSVVINEVLYSPVNNEPEWIELVNISDDSLNLKNWSVSDILSSPTKSFISPGDLIVSPGEYLLITQDTSINSFHDLDNITIIETDFGTLGNTEDGIIIYDFREGIIDSLKYKSSWGGNNGYSLERISFSKQTNDSSNWATSLSKERSTPGYSNSVLNAPSYTRGTFVINEIMFDPDVDNSEFVEFFNQSDDSINVGGWKIEDESGNAFRLSDTTFMIPPEKFFLFVSDSLAIKKYSLSNYEFKSLAGVSSLGLVNTGELILLKDLKGNIIDSVWYSDKWHNKNFNKTKNISLERINPGLSSNDPQNWSSSVSLAGATPGEENSIFTDNLNTEAGISVSPNPFSPDNDGFEDFCIINYNLSQQVAQVRIKIFDSKGRLVRNLETNMASGSKGSVIFDGTDDGGRALRIGIYIIFLEALSDNSGVVETIKSVVVVARKL